MEDSNVIFIKNLLDSGKNEYVSYNGQIVVSHIHDLSLFKYPCHLNAITILGCIGGEFRGSINLHNYHVKGRSLLVNYPQNIIQITETQNLHAFAVILSMDFLHSLSFDIATLSTHYINRACKNELIELPKNDFLNVVRYISLINDALSQKEALNNVNLIKHLTSSFLTYTEILHEKYTNEDIIDNATYSKQTAIKVDSFMELLAEYHSSEREICFYAEKMCITPKYLASIVLRATGKRASEWITEFVIMESKSLLRYSGMNIQEVARQLNFPTQSSFGKYFKAYTGISPSDYQSNPNIL